MKKLLSIFSMLMLAAASYAATVNIAWDSSTSTGLQSYKVYKASGATTIVAGTAPSSNPNAIVAVTVPSSQLSAAAGGLPDGAWSFSVTALGTNGLESVFGNVVSVTVVNAPPPPIGLLATVVSTSQIRLNWTDNSTTETGFSVKRGLDGVSFTQISITTANVATFTDAGLTPNTLYYYRVRATNSGGASAYTAIVSARTSPLAAPAPPTNLRITSVGP